MDPTDHSTFSTYREMVLEHLFVGEILKYCWHHQLPKLEVLKSQIDNSGYDIVLVANSIVRHVQLKSSHMDFTTSQVNINRELTRKSSGCVIWYRFDSSSLEFDHFLWFGGSPGKPLALLDDFKTAKHSKGNAQGIKLERHNIKYVPKSAFTRLASIGEVIEKLFGFSSTGEVIQSP